MVKNLTTEEFKEQVFDYNSAEEFKLKGEKGVIIDFWAPWCGPCKMIGPVLEELSEEYENDLDVIKINVDDEHEVGAVFGVRSIPTLLFAPIEGEPTLEVGARPKAQLEKIIKEVILEPTPQTEKISVSK